MSALAKLVRRARDTAHRRLFRAQWNVAIVKQPIAVVAGLAGEAAQAAALGSAIWLPEPRGGYVADPFGFRAGPDDWRILVEKYDWRRRIGTIEMGRFDGERFGTYQPLLESASHLSYPFVLDHDGETLFVPEHSAAREVAAYAISAEGRAVPKRPLLPDRALVDSSIVRHDGRYWLFAIENDRSWNAELHVWFADDLFGDWRPHPGNPVKVDMASARPAGTPFEHDGALHRPAQDCAERYGGRVVVNRVTALTPTAFAEEQVAAVSPAHLGRYDRGLHTLSRFGDWTLIDAARRAPVYWPG